MLSAKTYTPHERALGAALGVTIGLLPIFPFQIPVLLLLCVFIRCYRSLALVTVWVLNPITFIPIYVSAVWLGAEMLHISLGDSLPGFHITRQEFLHLMRHSSDYLTALIAGSSVISISGGVLTYGLTRIVITLAKKTRRIDLD